MALMLYLVRHACHDDIGRRLVGRAPGATLGPRGRRQAARLAVFFVDAGAEAMQSSPRERALETAAPIARALALPCEVVPALDEVDFGDWTGRTFDALRQDARWTAWNAARAAGRAPGGESMAEAQHRMVAQIERLRSAGAARAILVSHAEPIRAALLHYLDMTLDRWSEIEIAPAAVSTLAFNGGKATVLGINQTASRGTGP